MLFWDETRKAIDIITLKNKSPKALSIGDALKFYYKATLIPLVLAIILGAIVAAVGSQFISPFFSFGIAGAAALGILSPILLIWVFQPLGALVLAGVYHLFGKLFGQFKQDYTKTFNALLYVEFVTALVAWITVIPILGWIVLIVASVWSFVSIIVWISRFQKISLLASFLVIIGTVIVIVIIVFAVVFAIAAAVPGWFLSHFPNATMNSTYG